MVKDIVRITIVDDSKAEKGDAECGVDWSSTEAFTLASQRIEERFGDGAQLEYIDLAQSLTDRHALELKQKIEDEKLPVPLLFINGQPRIVGQFDIRLLLYTVEVELETGYEPRNR